MIKKYNRKKTWYFNSIISIPLRLSSLFRDKHIWVFGAWEGNRYDDSSKYLFEYINNEHSEISAYWITGKREIVDSITSAGHQALLIGTEDAKQIMLKAGAAFYSNGLDDFGARCYLYGSYICDLNHGACGLKRLYYNPRKCEESFVSYYLKKLKRKIFDWYYFDYTTTTSEYAKAYWMNAFDLNGKEQNKIKIHGIPRNDILACKRCKNDEITTVVYMPTYRPYENSVVADMLSFLNHDEEFQSFLVEHNVRILTKLHNADDTGKKMTMTSKNISLLTGDEIKSTQELLTTTDVLITDYSSCCIDFAVTGKPNIIYAPDYDVYDKRNGLIDMWKQSLLPVVVKKPDELIVHIKQAVVDPIKENKVTDILNEFFLDPALINNSSRKMVFDHVVGAVERKYERK